MKYTVETMSGALKYCYKKGWLNDTKVSLLPDSNSVCLKNLTESNIHKVFQYLRYFGWSELRTDQFFNFVASLPRRTTLGGSSVSIGDVIKMDGYVYQVIGFNILNCKYFVRFIRCNYIQEVDLLNSKFTVTMSNDLKSDICTFQQNKLRSVKSAPQCQILSTVQSDECRPLLQALSVPLPKCPEMPVSSNGNQSRLLLALKNDYLEEVSLNDDGGSQERYVCLQCSSNELRYANYFNDICFVCKHKKTFNTNSKSLENQTTGTNFCCYVQLPDDSSMSSVSEYTDWSETFDASESDSTITEESVEEDIRVYDSWSSDSTVPSAYSFDPLSSEEDEYSDMDEYSDTDENWITSVSSMSNNFSGLSNSTLSYDYVETVESLRKLSFADEVYYLSLEQLVKRQEEMSDKSRISTILGEMAVKRQESVTDIERVQDLPPPIEAKIDYFTQVMCERQVQKMEATTDKQQIEFILASSSIRDAESTMDQEYEVSAATPPPEKSSSRCALM